MPNQFVGQWSISNGWLRCVPQQRFNRKEVHARFDQACRQQLFADEASAMTGRNPERLLREFS